MFKVLTYFTDKQDNNHAYNTGDIYPRVGLKVSEERLKELSTDANRRRKPVIVEVTEKKKNVNADMPNASELVRQEPAEDKRTNNNRKRKNTAKRVPAKDTK
jgi:ribosomal protein L11